MNKMWEWLRGKRCSCRRQEGTRSKGPSRKKVRTYLFNEKLFNGFKMKLN